MTIVAHFGAILSPKKQRHSMSPYAGLRSDSPRRRLSAVENLKLWSPEAEVGPLLTPLFIDSPSGTITCSQRFSNGKTPLW